MGSFGFDFLNGIKTGRPEFGTGSGCFDFRMSVGYFRSFVVRIDFDAAADRAVPETEITDFNFFAMTLQ